MMTRIRSLIQSFTYWFGRRSMQSRLVAAYILILLIPSIIVSNYFFKQIRDTYISDALNQNSFLLEIEKMNMLNQIEAIEMAAQLAISDDGIKDYLRINEEPEPAWLIDLAWGPFKDIQRIQTNNPNITHLRLYTNNSNVTEMWPIIFQEKRIASEPWFPKVKDLDGGELWVFNYSDPDILQRYAADVSEELPKVSLIRQVHSGSYRGVIQVDMLLKHFAPKTFAGIVDESSQMVIVDQEGQLFMDRSQSFMTSHEGLRDEVAIQFANLKQQAGDSEETVHARFSLNGSSFLLIATPMERLHAHVLNVVSLEGALSNVSKAQGQIIAANIVLIFLLSIITYYLNSIILKSLRRLTETMKRVRKGEVTATIAIQGGGEVGELAHHFNKLIRTINELIAQGVRKQAVTKEAELRTLHSQIDSHFLYNTLENIKMLAEIEGQRTISDALTSLGGMMRYNFKWSGEYVKLKDEIRHIRNYIDVMNIRFDEPIRLELNIPSEFMELEVLKMSLQPIVENAVKHAWPEFPDQEKRIKIDAIAWEENRITINVTDNGIGMEPYRLGRLSEILRTADNEELPSVDYGRGGVQAGGIGLRNVHQRIRLFYGNEYGIEVKSEEGEFTQVTMTFPKVLLTGGGSGHEKSDDRG
ncbi:histidine kinase [Paenibacillus lautus]|uniref:cache domain-containing sensor histidine kinase n=1 Tax=Paenibacillus lautus TaxID=1401 RepID=UPI001B1090DE|nr:sensor histidine kinase [Paenibacillus lautus]GIO99323.1 histidine kinase [Paenibacillus lautus]